MKSLRHCLLRVHTFGNETTSIESIYVQCFFLECIRDRPKFAIKDALVIFRTSKRYTIKRTGMDQSKRKNGIRARDRSVCFDISREINVHSALQTISFGFNVRSRFKRLFQHNKSPAPTLA